VRGEINSSPPKYKTFRDQAMGATGGKTKEERVHTKRQAIMQRRTQIAIVEVATSRTSGVDEECFSTPFREKALRRNESRRSSEVTSRARNAMREAERTALTRTTDTAMKPGSFDISPATCSR